MSLMNQEPQDIIKTVVTELLQRMGFTASVEVTVGQEIVVIYLCAVRVDEGQNFLIGQYGMNLAALQHLVRIIVRKQVGEKLDIVVDVNDYFFDKKQLLEREAAQALEEVLQARSAVTLRPMLPYERKVIHSYLASKEGVMTESTGMGEARQVVVRPKEGETI